MMTFLYVLLYLAVGFALILTWVHFNSKEYDENEGEDMCYSPYILVYGIGTFIWPLLILYWILNKFLK